MGLLDYFRGSRTDSAAVAKERLQILVAHERAERNKPDYLPLLQKELLEVIRKYVNVGQDAITVTMEKDDNREVLELNVVLPDAIESRPKRKRG
ncbi:MULTISPECIES: cell division topological specificity factor MinE [Methylococcus]|jgi:cell division topological specificity factor|uniref:Cell division topological specificity factor n=2 Tax=Methylococcus capsulatus TaxID=414 RepID=MINE_METCA|nr:cell division topological specificity factor MinE [Methylococcus capsulatus]Q602J5.1 RecName: Full=Cell division topological specificity factor [Methylococcus capsulatus str. Bath]AAU90864.1 cell division topological specificity factor MinE [Methylococcus capsulatus str. Bath]QXP86530.1 cell division topological specificity factor MinE [Methylococcus capsulatus]QXP89251.1 cell division topological specificity factor MinE [Methylococcus capsulatus]QXP93800.1 cell division topological specifi